MNQQPVIWWMQIFNWVKDNTVVLGSIALGWKAIDKGFKFLSEGRESEITKIVQKEIKESVNPDIKELTEGIKELRESIWELSKEIKK
ncbi:MAG: hypothetical protein ACTHJ7_08305 [Candidatus Nitrosocosmicus sp.]